MGSRRSSRPASRTRSFEAIHPFLDGNGRVGRLLITLLLCHDGVLHQPLLYLGLFLRRRRAEYYEWLTAIRMRGDWEGWLRLFLHGVAESAEAAGDTAQRIVRLYQNHRRRIQEQLHTSNGARLLELLFEHPRITPTYVRDRLSVAHGTAGTLIERFVSLDLLEEIIGGQRNRRFGYAPYLALFSERSTEREPETPAQVTKP